ncbi:cadherin-related family member 5 isoform X3 [Octodon degus]|uniref:Cadherin-related family member 5 n=1 Tax=Octodon degus TaxID=10160 RepID=A0A6P6F228_OCTDE|nr:cadherin-related family member 5 isoform X3 [Octodon degus]
MGARALLWAPLLLLLVPPSQLPGAAAQGQVCSVDKTLINIEENSSPRPLVNISVPDGQHVTLGSSSTPSAFQILGNELFLNVTPDYEENTMLEAHLECRRGSTVVTQLVVLVSVLDVNDNAPEFPFEVKEWDVVEDTKVNSTVIPEGELKATDKDKEDVLYYTLQEVTPNASSFFSLMGVNRPALRLDRSLDFYQWQGMTFQLLVRDTRENVEPSHTATATLVLHVQPADLRPPWFLPCSYSDGYVCIQAQYHGAVPTGHILPSPLILHPGPIYAVDGDRGINTHIRYSILGGNTDNTFVIDPDSGNLTMAKMVPRDTTFILLIRGLNSAITYRITNCSEFRMNGETVFTAMALEHERIFYAEVEATNTVTGDTATAIAEIWVSEQAPPSIGPPEIPQTPEAGGTTRPLTSTATEAPRPPGTSPGPPVTSLEGATGSHPSLGTTLSLAAPTIPGGLPAMGASTSPLPATPSGVSAQTPKPGTSWATTPRVATGSSLRPAIPGGVSDQTLKPGTSQPMSAGSSRSSPASGTPGGGATAGGSSPEDQRFSTVDMAVLGGVLGALLLLALIGLAVLLSKHYGPQLLCCSRKAAQLPPHGFDNQAFLGDHEDTKASAPSPTPDPMPVETLCAPPDPEPLSHKQPNPEPQVLEPPGPESPVATRGAGDSPSAVRSILTKERRPEGGYKAVWFGEDIGAEADVVVLNTAEAGEDGDAGSEGSGEEDTDQDRGPHDKLGNSTYI